MAVAAAAGADWFARANAAAVALVAEAKGSTPSLGIRLLADLRNIFGERDAMATDEIIKSLCALDESPWGDIRGKAIDARGISHRLGAYGIKSKNVRIGNHVPKGYARADLWDAWQRYLGVSPLGDATCATPATNPAAVAPVAHVAHPVGEAPSSDAAQSLVHIEAVRRNWSDDERAAWLADAITNPDAVIESLRDAA